LQLSHDISNGFSIAMIAAEAELDALRENYNDLIMQVMNKHPDETRHETAKRYIQNAEHQDNPPGQGKTTGG